MSIVHHPEDATLMGYAAGTLSEPFSIVVASHMEMCPACRARVRSMTDLGAATMLEGPPAELGSAALGGLMARLDQPAGRDSARRKPLPAAPASRTGLPDALARVAGGGLDQIAWREIVAGAADRMVYFKSKSGTHSLRFLRADPGVSLPDHAHVGTELTLVLHGALKDGSEIYGPGDVTDMDDEGTHNPVVHGSEVCYCVIANEAPPLFSQLKFKILQKLIGI